MFLFFVFFGVEFFRMGSELPTLAGRWLYGVVVCVWGGGCCAVPGPFQNQSAHEFRFRMTEIERPLQNFAIQ